MKSLFLRVNDFIFDTLIASVKWRLFILALLIYLLNPVVYSSTDTLPTQLVAVSLIREHDFDLNEFASVDYKIRLNELNTFYVDGRLLSLHPVLTGLLAAPLYYLFSLAGYSMDSYVDIGIPARTYAAFVSALSVVFLYMAAREVAGKRSAWLCSLVYAFGTCTWSISSQDLWSHGTSQMFLGLSVYLLFRGLRDRRFTSYAGFFLSCAVAARPTNLMVALVLSIYVFRRHRGVFPGFLVWALPPLVFLIAYSWVYLHSLLFLNSGYTNPLGLWTTPLYYGFFGLLFSPSKGLFVYSPLLLFSFVGMYRVWRVNDRFSMLFRYVSVSVFLLLLFWSGWYEWHGGFSYGYRMLVDLTPVLCLFLAPVFERYSARPWLYYLLTLLAVYSVLIQAVGVFFDDSSWERATGCYYYLSGVHACLWDIKKSQIVYYVERAIKIVHGPISL